MAHPSVRFLLFRPPRTPPPRPPPPFVGFPAERKPRRSRSRTKRSTVLSYSLHLLYASLPYTPHSRRLPLFLAASLPRQTLLFCSGSGPPRFPPPAVRPTPRSFSLFIPRNSGEAKVRSSSSNSISLLGHLGLALSLHPSATLTRARPPSLFTSRHPRSPFSVPPSTPLISVAPARASPLSPSNNLSTRWVDARSGRRFSLSHPIDRPFLHRYSPRPGSPVFVDGNTGRSIPGVQIGRAHV